MLSALRSRLLKCTRLAHSALFYFGKWFVRLCKREVAYSWSAAILQGVSILGCEILLLFRAPPGVAVTCLALAAIVMSFRIPQEDFKRLERIVWIALSAVFLFAEISAITTDRTNTEMREVRDRTEERQKFEAVIEQGRTINEKQRQELVNLSTLLSQGRHSIKDLGNIANRVTEANSLVTGGTSFPYISAYQAEVRDGKHIMGFALHKDGTYPLFDLHVMVGRPFTFTSSQKIVVNAVNYSGFPSRNTIIYGASCRFLEINGRATTSLVGIAIGNEESVYFLADLSARNGTWQEVINVRIIEGNPVVRFVVYKNDEIGLRVPQVVMDHADPNFPVEHRLDEIGGSVPVSDISTRQTAIEDANYLPSKCEISNEFKIVFKPAK